MAWQTITASDVLSKLSGAELSALQTAALGDGQTDPLPGIVTAVVDEVRGYIAANRNNRLGAAGTVPSKLVSASLSIIRHRLCTRLPVKSLLTEERVKEKEDAIRLLERTSDGRFAIEDPQTDETSVAKVQQVSKPTRKTSREKLAGL
jgi:phage gp36-like protein